MKKVDKGCVNSTAPFFCNYVLEYLLRDKSLGKNREERDRLLKSGGLTIKTTVDLDYQEAADNSVEGHVRATDQAIGSLAMIEPGTGNVKAIAQSRPMGNAKKGDTYLNYIVPSQYGDSNGFQAGSTFKVFVLADAIEKGTSLGETLPAPASTIFDQSDFANCPGEPPLVGTFPMSNSVQSNTGVENLYTGTRNSINTFFFNLEKTTGVCDPYELARAMGIQLTAPNGKENSDGDLVVQPERVPNFTLGVADVSPLEMAEAYATFAARGLHCDARPVTSIQDANGNLLKKYEPQCQQVMRETTADAVNDILAGVINGGFASNEALSVARRGQDRHHRHHVVVTVGLVRRLHAPGRDRGHDRRRQRVRHPDQPRRPHHERPDGLGLRLRPRRAHVGRRDAGHRRPARLRGVHLPGHRAGCRRHLRLRGPAAQEQRRRQR